MGRTASSCFHVCNDIRDMTEGAVPDFVEWHVRMDISKLRSCLCDAAEFYLYNNA